MNNALNLDPDALATLAATASFCHSDQAKPHSAMLLRKSGVAVATDGHRMAVMSLPALAGLDDDVQVRPNGLTDLARAIGRGGAHGELSVALDEMSLQLNTDANPGPDSKWAWPIQVETFPDYERVIPTAQPVQIRLDTQLLQRALVQLRPFLEAGHPELDGFEYFPCVELRVNTVDQRMSLRVDQSLGYHPVADGVANEPGSAAVATLPSATGDTQLGAPQLRWHHQVDLKLEPVHGVTERFTVRLDGHYLDDAIALLAPAAGGSGPGSTVAMHLTDATSVVSLYDASGARSYFLMPVK